MPVSPLSSSPLGSADNQEPARARGARLLLLVLCDKWRAPVLLALEEGTLRYGDLSRKTPGISRTMLTRALRDLERAGMVRREVFAQVPAKVEYSLMPWGQTLAGQVRAMDVWAQAHESDLRETAERLQQSRSRKNESKEDD